MSFEGTSEENVFMVCFAVSHIVHILMGSVFQKR